MCSKWAPEVARRLREDTACLEKSFGPLGAFREITGPHSDLHEDFSAVYFAHFENVSLVYKPRSLVADIAFTELYTGQFGAPAVRFLDCGDHGWMEFIEADDVPVPPERWGWALALLTSLRSSDHHRENVIKRGGWPYFIDLECSLVPEMTFAPREDKRFSPRATRVDVSGPEVAAGYRDAIARLDRRALLATLDRLRGRPMRVVVRQTAYYQALVDHARELPEAERHGVVLAHLTESAPGFPEVCRFEADRVARGIIPKFTYDPEGHDLRVGALVFRGLVAHPGWPLARAAVLDEEALSVGAAELESCRAVMDVMS